LWNDDFVLFPSHALRHWVSHHALFLLTGAVIFYILYPVYAACPYCHWIAFSFKETLPKLNRIPLPKKAFTKALKEVLTKSHYGELHHLHGIIFPVSLLFLKLITTNISGANLTREFYLLLTFGLISLGTERSSLINSTYV